MACGAAGAARSEARSAWGLLAVAITAYGGTAIYYTVVPSAASKFPSVYDLGLFGFYPLAFAALVVFVRRQVSFAGALWIDSVLGAVVVAALGAAVVWPQLDGAHGLSVLGQLFFLLGDLGFWGSCWLRTP